MQRRDFMKVVLAAAGVASATEAQDTGPKVMTVAGPVSADALGMVLPHEHVMVDFIGAKESSPLRYSSDEVVATVLPHLAHAQELGVRTLVECTPAYLARDPRILRRLSDATGLHIITNTGYYGAANDKFLPYFVIDEDADAIAERWIREWRDGIDGSGVRPGFIKIGVDPGPLSDVDAKPVRAACRTHRATGLAIASHTTDGVAATASLDILEREGVPAGAYIWVHAHAESSVEILVKAGKRGAWLEFDGIAPDTIEQHVTLVRAMQDAALCDHVLVSHDAGWYNVGEPGGGTFRGYDTLSTRFLPAIREAGFSEEQVRQLTVANPAAAFAVRRPML